MGHTAQEFFEKHKKASGQMKECCPDLTAGFGGMFAKIMKDGALSVKEKELIALGIGVAIQCEPCIRIHTQKCIEAEATKEQILEAASVAVMMGGGPAYTHVPMVIETLEALQK
jgi:4-carboxymuconolactone decarboxylase